MQRRSRLHLRRRLGGRGFVDLLGELRALQRWRLVAVVNEDPVAVSVTNSTVTGNDSGFDGALDLVDEGVTASLAYNTVVGTGCTRWRRPRSPGGSARPTCPTRRPTCRSTWPRSSPTSSRCPVTALRTARSGDRRPRRATTGPTTRSCLPTPDATDKVASPNDPLLNALGVWGGPTDTMLPADAAARRPHQPGHRRHPGGGLLQTGIAAGVTTDQRGVTRPQLVGCDIGAVEVTQQDYQVEAAAVTPKFTG